MHTQASKNNIDKSQFSQAEWKRLTSYVALLMEVDQKGRKKIASSTIDIGEARDIRKHMVKNGFDPDCELLRSWEPQPFLQHVDGVDREARYTILPNNTCIYGFVDGLQYIYYPRAANCKLEKSSKPSIN